MSLLPSPLQRWLERVRRDRALHLGPIAIARSESIARARARLREAEIHLRRGGPLDMPDSASAPRASRSVVFLHNAYYNFLYLAKGLRARGWDAVSVSLEPPDGPNAQYYHGNDINLFDADGAQFAANVAAFFATVPQRFRMVHFYGRGHMSFFPTRYDRTNAYEVMPSDFIELRQKGVKIGYTISGCLDGVAQSSVARWSGGLCDKCVWQHDAAICSDRGNLAWGHKIAMFCDLIATEIFPALDYQAGPLCFREPLTSVLDQDFWHPDLAVPPQYRLERAPGEMIVYHAVGNFETRAVGGRNIKGSGAVIAAIERLRNEGMNVRLKFVSNVPNKDVRFLQVQADVIVDQLNHGRYGATAREGMMLGKPTICYINKGEPGPGDDLDSIRECPLVSANEETIYDVLKALLQDRGRRQEISRASRAYALKWHSIDACAARFERVYDALMAGEAVTGVAA
jgi:glycosyltransferase involved in cell wall biosynthesis